MGFNNYKLLASLFIMVLFYTQSRGLQNDATIEAEKTPSIIISDNSTSRLSTISASENLKTSNPTKLTPETRSVTKENLTDKALSLTMSAKITTNPSITTASISKTTVPDIGTFKRSSNSVSSDKTSSETKGSQDLDLTSTSTTSPNPEQEPLSTPVYASIIFGSILGVSLTIGGILALSKHLLSRKQSRRLNDDE